MSGPLRLVSYRDEVVSGIVVILTDDTRYTKNVMPDEELERAADLRGYQKLFLEGLCDKWYELFREKVRCIPPEGEGQEWMIVRGSDEVIEGEIVTPQIGSGVHELLEEIQSMPNPYKADTIEGEVITDAARKAIEGGGH